MEDITLSWPGSMTTKQAKKYLLTSGFVAVELFRQQFAQSETQHQCTLSGRHSLYPDCNFCPICGKRLRILNEVEAETIDNVREEQFKKQLNDIKKAFGQKIIKYIDNLID